LTAQLPRGSGSGVSTRSRRSRSGS
jgi:hypothetical protein